MKVDRLLFLFIVFFSKIVASHEAPSSETYNTVGAVTGKSIGSGLFYRHTQNNFYLQISGLYFPTQVLAAPNVGVAGGYYFHEESLLRLRVPIKLHVYLAANREYFFAKTNSTVLTATRLKGMFYTSIGVALDVYHPTHRNFGAMIGASYGSRAHVRSGEYDYFDLNDGWVSNVFSIFYQW